jgi:hypothetical protein
VSYREEESTLLMAEVLPLLAQLLIRVEAIAGKLKEHHQEKEARIEVEQHAEARAAGLEERRQK